MKNRITFFVREDSIWRDFSGDRDHSIAYSDLPTFELKKGTLVEYNCNSNGHHQIWHEGKLLNAWDKKSDKKIDGIYPDGLLQHFSPARDNNLSILLDE